MATSDTPTPTTRSPRRLLTITLWILAIGAIVVTVMMPKRDAGDAASSSESGAESDTEPGNGKVVARTIGTPIVRRDLEEFSLTDRTGREITRKDLLGHPWVASFVFTRCITSCPAITLEMKKLHDRLQDSDVKFVTVTVDPKFDTVERLAEYAENFGADPERWYFLTGDDENIYRLVNHGFGIYAEEQFGQARKPGYEVAHQNRVVLVNTEGYPTSSFRATTEAEMVTLRKVLEGTLPFPEPLDPDAPAETTAEPKQSANEPPVKPQVPRWVVGLPGINAGLNGLATVLLLSGYALIRYRKVTAHKYTMLATFFVSMAFLACYLTYHSALQHYTGSSSRRFEGDGIVRTVYLSILASHVVLAAIVPILASITIYRGLRQQWEQHRRIAKWTFPIWVYVSVTGVMIYVMLYQMSPAGESTGSHPLRDETMHGLE